MVILQISQCFLETVIFYYIKMETTLKNLDENMHFSHDYKKIDILKISPTTGSIDKLNKGGDIVFKSTSSENSLHISESYLYFEIEIEPGKDAAGAINDIALENNFFPSLFSSMRLKLANSDVETIYSPGICSTMLNFLTLNKEDEIIGWVPDNEKGDTTTDSYKFRKEFYKTKFTGYFPLDVFGFLNDYNRIVHSCQIELILNRNIKDEQIYYGDAGTKAKLKLNTLEWHIPELTLSPKNEASLIERLNTDKSININYLERITNNGIVLQGGTSSSIQIGPLSYRAKYIIIGFKDTDISFEKNNNLFIQKGLTSLQIQLNNTYYPQNPMEFDIDNNNQIFPYTNYKNIVKKFRSQSELFQLRCKDFSNLYPIFYFDLSNQDQKLIMNGCTITIHMKKTDAFKPNLYYVILQEKSIEMKLNGGKITLIENVSLQE